MLSMSCHPSIVQIRLQGVVTILIAAPKISEFQFQIPRDDICGIYSLNIAPEFWTTHHCTMIGHGHISTI
jgi:hypothetical protein